MVVYCPVCPPGTMLEESGGEYWCPWEERPVTAAAWAGTVTAEQLAAIAAGFAVAGINDPDARLGWCRRWAGVPALPGIGNLSWPEAGQVLEQLERVTRGVRVL